MKYAALLGFLLLTACATVPTLDELEHRAMLTGDWTEVERREKVIARRAAERGINCPAGYVSFCVKGVRNECSCVDRDTLANFFDRF